MRTPLAFILALVASGCGAVDCPPAATPSAGAYVQGTVTAGGKPVEAAQVTLTDAAGTPVEGVARARTDAAGGFFAPQLPASHTYVMEARFRDEAGHETVLKTLTQPGGDAASAEVSAATTVLATALTRGKSGLPGAFSTSTFEAAVQRIAQALAAGGAPDLGDAAAVTAWLDARSAEDATLKGAVDALKSQTAATEPREAVEAQVRAADPVVDPLDALKPVY